MRLILASQSPYRKLQLQNFGLSFEAHKPLVEEEHLKAQGPKDLKALTVFLATAKAQSLMNAFPDAMILGSDQLAELDGERLDKPGHRERAKAQLMKMQGRTHRLMTSLAVIAKGATRTYTDITEIELKPLDETTIDAYLDKDEPYDCAGSYKIEKAGLGLVARMQSQDPSAIQGLPMLSLVQAFADFKIPLATLWRMK